MSELLAAIEEAAKRGGMEIRKRRKGVFKLSPEERRQARIRNRRHKNDPSLKRSRALYRKKHHKEIERRRQAHADTQTSVYIEAAVDRLELAALLEESYDDADDDAGDYEENED